MNSSLLERLIGKDFHIIGEGRWGSTEEHSSLVIDRERDIFFWNSKEIFGNALDWLTKIKGYSYPDALKSLGNEDKRAVILTKVVKEEEPICPQLVDIFWEDGKDNREYWYERCLTDETIDKYKLGFHRGWYMLPIFVGSIFRNFQMRRDTPTKRIISYYRGVGALLINSIILNYVSQVFITEGPVDALLLTQEGIPAISHNGGSHGWKGTWFKNFLNQKEIYCIADNDKAGKSGAKKIANSLGQHRVKIFFFEDKPERYDTVDYFRGGGTIDKFKEIVYNGSKYVFELS